MSTLDWTILETHIENAFSQIVEQFKTEQQAQMQAEKWNWPRDTMRKARGLTPAGPRDIIDTQELFDSLNVERINPNEALYSYNVDHAMIVHQGATLSTGTVIPPRPWVDEAARMLAAKLVSMQF